MVSPVCVGGSPIGGVPAALGYEVPSERAHATVLETFESGINFLDTSNNYGDGESERRIGKVLEDRGGLPEGFVLATKAERDSVTGDFSGEKVRRSAEESLGRLELERFQLYYLHDPECVTFAQATAPGRAVEAMVALREEGIAEHIGVAAGPVRLLLEFLDLEVFEVVLTHNRSTLVDRSAELLLDVAAARGVGGGKCRRPWRRDPRAGDLVHRSVRLPDRLTRSAPADRRYGRGVPASWRAFAHGGAAVLAP